MNLIEFPKERVISIADLYAQTIHNYPKNAKVSYGQGPITSGGAAHDKSLTFEQVVPQNRDFACTLAYQLPTVVNESEWLVLAHLMGKREHWVDGALTTLRGNEFLYVWSGIIAGMNQDTFVQFLSELASSKVKPAPENEPNYQFRWRQYVLLYQFTVDFARRNRSSLNPAQNLICFPDSFGSMGSRYEQNLAHSLDVSAHEVVFHPDLEQLQSVGIVSNAVFQCLRERNRLRYGLPHQQHPIDIAPIPNLKNRRKNH